MTNCFACNRIISTTTRIVDTRDNQLVFVGADCYKRIAAAREAGYQPPQGGPRLYLANKGHAVIKNGVAVYETINH